MRHCNIQLGSQAGTTFRNHRFACALRMRGQLGTGEYTGGLACPQHGSARTPTKCDAQTYNNANFGASDNSRQRLKFV